MVEIKRIEITPKMAAEFLEKNFSDNRNIRNSVIEQYASDMRNERWTESGETIKFDEYGNLVDGQHRLQAVIKSGKTVAFFVVYGLKESAMTNIDIGARRTASDALKVFGITDNQQAKGTLAKRILLHEAGKNALTSTLAKAKTNAGTKFVVTVSQIVEYVSKNDLSRYCTEGQRLYQIQISNILTPSDWIFLSWLLPKSDAVHAHSFLEKLATLDGISGDSPIKSLFRKLQDKMSGTQKMMEINAAFQAYILGKSRYRAIPEKQKRITA